MSFRAYLESSLMPDVSWSVDVVAPAATAAAMRMQAAVEIEGPPSTT